MAKQTKRSRKFERKGGVKGHLEKKGSTITNKGKLKHRSSTKKNKNSEIPQGRKNDSSAFLLRQEKEEKRQEADFVSERNLGDLDMDSFFESFETNDDEESSTSSSSDKEKESEKSDSDNGSDKEEKNNEDKESVSSSNSSDSSNDEEDDDEALEAASKKMKQDMAKLSKSDPDFYEFLQENEQSLLEFEADKDEESKNEEKEEENKEKDTTTTESSYVHLTPKLLKSFQEGAFKAHGIKSLKRIVAAYKTACHMSDDDTDAKNKRYLIDDSDVFDQLMVSCLENVHEELQHHLLSNDSGKEEKDRDEDDDKQEDENDKPIHPKLLEKAEKWNSAKPIMESFFKSTLHLLGQAKEPKLLAFVCKALLHYVRYLTPFPRLANSMLTACTTLWSAPLGEEDEDYQVVRLQAFLRIRQLALTQPFPFVETCLKKIYLAYAKRCKFVSETTLPTLTFMGNCVVELYNLDWHSSYQHAFVYVRQLALLLRTAMQKKTPDSFQAVYCWQYMHCLKLWTAILVSASLKDGDSVHDGDAKLMQSLLYPLVEVILGVVRLIPTARHVPLRLHCVRLLQQLAAAYATYIPTSAILLDVLDFKEISLKPKKIANRNTTQRGINLPLLLKLPKEAPLRTKEQVEAVMSEVFLLLNREVDLYRYSAGFPEFSVRICQRLRKFSKETKNGRWRAYAKASIELCERHASFCVQGRSKLEQAPKDVKILEVLKPSGEPNMNVRYEAAIAKENKLLMTSRPAMAPSTSTNKRKAQEEEEQEEVEEKPSKKRKKKTKTPRKVNESDLKNTGALEQDDQIEEGIDWSDDESD